MVCHYIKKRYRYFKDRDLGSGGTWEKAILFGKNSQVYHGLINHRAVINGNHYGPMLMNKAELARAMLSLWQRDCVRLRRICFSPNLKAKSTEAQESHCICSDIFFQY